MEIRLLGNSSLEHIENRIKIVAGAGKLSRFKGNVFEVLSSCNDYEKNLNLIKRIIKMGHKSIIEHDYLVFALVDVSPIVEQTIIGNRLTSFTIKSRREVDFRSVGYYIPDFRNIDGKIHLKNDELKAKYKNHMKYLFDEYGYFADSDINVEDARFVLPYSYHSNIIMGMDARELEKLVISLKYGKLSKIAELKELGEKLIAEITVKVPYLMETINNYEDKTKEFFDFNNYKNEIDLDINILSKPKLISYTHDCDNEILTSYLMGIYQCDKAIAQSILKDLSYKNKDFNDNLMKYIVTKNENRELEQVNFQFQIPISLAILTHLTRHRTQSLITPDFIPLWDMENYIIPPSIKKFDAKRYKKIFETNIKMFNYFKEQKVMDEDLIYFYLSGHMCNVLTTMNGRTLEWICKMRCCNKAQWQIRNIMNEIAKQIEKVAPIYGKYLGSSCKTTGECPEGTESCKNKINTR
jgi:thymidylate synthase (FAD)